MPANLAEMAQLKSWLIAMTELLQAIEARDKAEALQVKRDGAPPPMVSRIR